MRHSLQCNAEVKNVWKYIATLPYDFNYVLLNYVQENITRPLLQYTDIFYLVCYLIQNSPLYCASDKESSSCPCTASAGNCGYSVLFIIMRSVFYLFI